MKKKWLGVGIALSLGTMLLSLPYGEAAAATETTISVEDRQNSLLDNPIAEIDSGVIFGSRESNGVKAFKGIPYADTTAGKNRFRPPQPVKPWSGMRDCTQFGPIAVQKEAGLMGPWTSEYLDLGMNLANGRMSEDCLNLNVWSSAKPGENQPVIVYIHGGANVSGSSENDIYTGKEIAAKGVVYVSLNYRVGIFGFLAYKDAKGEEVTGNFALQDQIAALKWVQKNIKAFGGDANNVTIMGQSAGSCNVQNLISSQAAAGLFNRAIALSLNNVTTEFPVITTLTAAEQAASKALQGKNIAELRQMSPEEILQLGYNPSTAVRDTSTGTLPLKEAFSTGRWNKVDMIWGGVAGDQYIFDSVIPVGNVFSPQKNMTTTEYEAKVKAKFGQQAANALHIYPVQKEALQTAKQVNQDSMIASYAYAGQLKEKAAPAYRTYIYYYDHILPDSADRQQEYGAFHTSDVSYWLNHYSQKSARRWADADYKLGEQMSSYIVNFAKSGNPNGNDGTGKALPVWAELKADQDIAYLHIGDDISYETMTPEKSHLWKQMWK